MSHISRQRLRRLLILSALLFSLGWFANGYFICHMPYEWPTKVKFGYDRGGQFTAEAQRALRLRGEISEVSLFTSPRNLSALCASAVKKEFPNWRDSIFKDHSYDAWHTANAGA